MVLDVKISCNFYACSVWPWTLHAWTLSTNKATKMVFGIPSFNMNVRLLLKWIPRSIFYGAHFMTPRRIPFYDRPSLFYG